MWIEEEARLDQIRDDIKREKADIAKAQKERRAARNSKNSSGKRKSTAKSRAIQEDDSEDEDEDEDQDGIDRIATGAEMAKISADIQSQLDKKKAASEGESEDEAFDPEKEIVSEEPEEEFEEDFEPDAETELEHNPSQEPESTTKRKASEDLTPESTKKSRSDESVVDENNIEPEEQTEPGATQSQESENSKRKASDQLAAQQTKKRRLDARRAAILGVNKPNVKLEPVEDLDGPYGLENATDVDRFKLSLKSSPEDYEVAGVIQIKREPAIELPYDKIDVETFVPKRKWTLADYPPEVPGPS
jgi:hypothetical protein